MTFSPLELLSRDDWIYTGILVSSFVISLMLRLDQNDVIRPRAGGLVGFVMAVIVLGWKIMYSLSLAIYVAICIKFAPKRLLTSIVFVTSFVYLIVIRYLHYVFDVEELASQANVVQLIMTLRVIGLSFEVSDSHYAQERLNSSTKQNRQEVKAKQKRFLAVYPSLLDVLNYFYHFAGLFTGPYYTYQMLLDSQEPTLFDEWSPVSEIRERALRLCWSVPIFILVNKFYPLDGLRSDDVWEMTFLQRMIYAAAVFVVFRARVYSAWAVAEVICVTLGLGVYPADSKPRIVVGPTDLEKYRELKGLPNVVYSSEAIINLDIYEIELSDGFRSGIRSWNKSVQSWLALYVYSRTRSMYRAELTMFVSALWHGTYGGYFMSFLVVPMCITVEDIIFKYVPIDLSTKQRPTWFRYLYVFTLRCRGFDMLATGFLLKNFNDTHRFWSSLYYWLLVVTLPIYMFNKLYVLTKRKQKSTLKEL